ncbi:MFS transporter [Ectothiorhodospiraceae bacterium 2226]|nr:MFS transporter [Ectothiorhodospiraceae bacterium 2226]
MNLARLVNVEPHEVRAVLWSFVYFFALLCSYYVLRPVRDEMGITAGVENLQWLFTGTFIAMLVAVPIYGYAVRRFARRRLVPVVYGFFVLNLLGFYALFQSPVPPAYVAMAFFVWVSVFNLFVVSVFWSFMADLYSDAQARRLFGFIAAGGSAGAILGPMITTLLAVPLGPVNLLLISAALLLVATFAVSRLGRGAPVRALSAGERDAVERPVGGGVFAGFRLFVRSPYLLGIGAYILLYTTLATFLYFQQAHIVRDAFDDSATRTAVFAAVDLAVNTLTLLTQIFITSRLVKGLGLGRTLALVPAFLLFGFAALAAAPVLVTILAVQILRRAGNFAIARPAREMLFTVVSREEKYKAKSVIDTVVYRGGDAVSGWAFAGLMALGLGLGGIALVAVPLAALWLGVGLWLGRRQEALGGARRATAAPGPAVPVPAEER